MNIKIKYFLLISILCSSELKAEQIKQASACPEITADELKNLNGGHVLTIGAHRWYLHDLFELPENLGSHIPLDLTITDVMKAKQVSYFGQLDSHTCQYKIVMEKERKANLTLKLMGE